MILKNIEYLSVSQFNKDSPDYILSKRTGGTGQMEELNQENGRTILPLPISDKA